MGQYATLKIYDPKEEKQLCEPLYYKNLIPWYVLVAFARGAKRCGRVTFNEDDHGWLIWSATTEHTVDNLEKVRDFCRFSNDLSLRSEDYVKKVEDILRWFKEARDSHPGSIAELDYCEIALNLMFYDEVVVSNEPNLIYRNLKELAKLPSSLKHLQDIPICE